MAWYRCYNCRRYDLPGFEFFEFEAGGPSCPRCGGAWPAVVLRWDVHLLLADPRGALLLADGKRWRLACDPKRDHLAEHPEDKFSASGDPRATTCPSCKGVPEWVGMMKALEDPTVRRMLQIHEQTCCG